MDISSSWFSELGMEDPLFMDQCGIVDSFDEELAAAIGEDFLNCLSPESNSSSSNTFHRSNSTNTLCASAPPPMQQLAPPPPPPPPPSHPQSNNKNVNKSSCRPTKQHKPNSYNSAACTINNSNMPPSFDIQPSSAPIILNFDNSSENGRRARSRGATEEETVPEVLNDPARGGKVEVKKAPSRIRPPSQTYDHIIAERKRREQLSQRFVALSAIVPGLKKMDKTSVLGDAIKYLKQLQERVKTLEEKSAKQTVESVVLVKKSQLVVDDDDEGSWDENFISSSSDSLPEVEAKVCDRNILIRIHCEKHKGVLVKILSELEKLNLGLVNTSVSRFGTLTLDITIIAEMEKEFCTSVKDIVKCLRSAMRCVAQTV